MTRGRSLATLLLFAACAAGCGRPFKQSGDAGIDGGPSGAAGAPTGDPGGANGGGASGGAVAGAGGSAGAGAGGGGGTAGQCRCSDGKCCGSDQLCEIPTGACLAVAVPDGACVPRPTVCNASTQPVCGCDGNTYSNDCYRQMAGTPKQMDGGCDCPSLQPAGACSKPGKVCVYGLNSDPSCRGLVTCDPTTGQWVPSPPVCL